MKFSEKGRQWFFRNNQPMNVGEKAADGFFPQMERICGVIAPSPVSFHGIEGHFQPKRVGWFWREQSFFYLELGWGVGGVGTAIQQLTMECDSSP